MGDAKTVTKKVRMSRDRAKRLAALAKKTGRSESDVLRDGLDLAWRRQEQREALQAIIDTLAPGEKYEKVRFEMS
jgi:predicted DNA-binding protein